MQPLNLAGEKKRISLLQSRNIPASLIKLFPDHLIFPNPPALIAECEDILLLGSTLRKLAVADNWGPWSNSQRYSIRPTLPEQHCGDKG